MHKFSLDGNFGIKSAGNRLELYLNMCDPIFGLKDIGITRRVINHWDSQGLIVTEREAPSKWRKFSFIEYVWLRIVKELREMGVSLEIIKKVKDELFKVTYDKQIYQQLKDNPDKLNNIPDEKARNDMKNFLNSKEFEEMSDDYGFPEFFNLLFHTIVTKEIVSVIIFTDGHFLPLYDNSYQYYKKESLERIIFDTHITVSLSKIVKEFLVSERSTYALPKLKILEINELKLLEIISSGEYETVTINFKNKKMKSLDMVKEQDVKRKIVDILTENSYQDIIIKSHKGMVTKIQNTVKMILD